MPDQQKYLTKLANSRILIIGGTSGIGYAVAECLLEHDSTIIIASSNQQRVSDKVDTLKQAYPSRASRISGFTCDLANQYSCENNIKQLFEKATDNGAHKLDHIIHTAGDAITIPTLQDVTVDPLVERGMVRFYAVILLFKYAPQFLNPGPSSSIVLTTGTTAQRPYPGQATLVGYAAGLEGVCKGMALDLAPLRVVLVSVGPVKTELWDRLGRSEEQQRQMLKKFEDLPTGGVGKPEDVAEAYVYALKDRNCTGCVVTSDGGRLVKGV